VPADVGNRFSAWETVCLPPEIVQDAASAALLARRGIFNPARQAAPQHRPIRRRNARAAVIVTTFVQHPVQLRQTVGWHRRRQMMLDVEVDPVRSHQQAAYRTSQGSRGIPARIGIEMIRHAAVLTHHAQAHQQRKDKQLPQPPAGIYLRRAAQPQHGEQQSMRQQERRGRPQFGTTNLKRDILQAIHAADVAQEFAQQACARGRISYNKSQVGIVRRARSPVMLQMPPAISQVGYVGQGAEQPGAAPFVDGAR